MILLLLNTCQLGSLPVVVNSIKLNTSYRSSSSSRESDELTTLAQAATDSEFLGAAMKMAGSLAGAAGGGGEGGGGGGGDAAPP